MSKRPAVYILYKQGKTDKEMEQDLEVGTDREAESGLERFVGGDTLKQVFPKGSKRVPGFPLSRE